MEEEEHMEEQVGCVGDVERRTAGEESPSRGLVDQDGSDGAQEQTWRRWDSLCHSSQTSLVSKARAGLTRSLGSYQLKYCWRDGRMIASAKR